MTTQPNAGASSRGYHRVATYATCPQKFAYWDLLGLEPATMSDNLALGSLLHIGLMHHYLKRLGSAQAVDPFDAMRSAPRAMSHMFERARLVLTAYFNHWRSDPLEPLDVEREFEVKIEGFRHTARIDLVASLGNAVVFVDHKSAQGTPNASTWQLSGQIMSQDAIGRAVCEAIYRKPFSGVMINAVGTKAPFAFSRLPIQVAKDMQARVLSGIADVNRLIETDVKTRDPWNYRRNPEACFDRWGPCAYLELCKRGRFALDGYISSRDVARDLAEGASR